MTIEDVNAVATGNETVDIAESAYHQIRNSKKSVIAIDTKSETMATGSPWKFPVDMYSSPISSGLSVAE